MGQSPAVDLTAEFDEFVTAVEARLRRSLTAGFGAEIGREAAADALAYAWVHWERVSVMDNPGGYLYTVGRNAARKLTGGRTRALASVGFTSNVDVEPGLDPALERLPEQQRTVVSLLYGYEFTMREVAEILGISKSSVQTHAERALSSLRQALGVAT